MHFLLHFEKVIFQLSRPAAAAAIDVSCADIYAGTVHFGEPIFVWLIQHYRNGLAVA